jgi:TIGR03009 family protein
MAMRLPLLAVVLLLLGGRFALAQQPIQKQPEPQPNPQQQAAALEAILGNWQKAFAGVNKLHIKDAKRTMKDVVFVDTSIFQGDIKFLAPRRFLVDLKKVDKGQIQPAVFDRVVCTGNASFQFDPKNKVIFVQPLPDKKAADDTIMGFLFPDMKMGDFKNRYRLTLLPPPPASAAYYYFIDIEPVLPQDKQVFSRARLVLNRSNFLPRQLYYIEPNGSQVTWDFPQIHTSDANVQPSEFNVPTLPSREWSFRQRVAESPPPPRPNK